MVEHRVKGTEPKLWATILIYFTVIALALLCVLPLWHILAISLNAKHSADLVFLWPKDWSFESYAIMLTRNELFDSLWVSVKRVVLGVILNTVLTVLMGYPLSRDGGEYKTRKVYVAILIFCMLFNGGMVPTVILVSVWLNLNNTIWALVLPGAVPIFNVILVMNFMRQMPKEIEEAAWIDGANSLKTLIYIVIPLSVPVIATVMMFSFVTQWNEWFSGLLYMTDVAKYPFQTYIQSTITAPDISNMIDLQNYASVSDKTIKAAQTIVGMIPLIIVYPFVQKYFAAGITLGAVKG